MKRKKLVNLSGLGNMGTEDFFPSFTVGGFTFSSQAIAPGGAGIHVHTPAMAVRNNRIHKQNAYVEYEHLQDDSILFSGGMIGTVHRPTQKRKILEDILILGSLLTAHNWAFYSRRNSASYPVTATNHLRTISRDHTELQPDLQHLLNRLTDTTWQTQFDNGFHLKMLLNNSNILNTESRFLSQVIIWEFLFAKLFGRESNNLHEITTDILEYFWPGRVNRTIFTTGRAGGVSRNVFYVLRNQLAHSGKLPIDRTYAEAWMTVLPWEAPPLVAPRRDLQRYLRFFGELTEVIVMKTMDFHPETRTLFNAFNFTDNLDNFLNSGQL